MYDNLSEGHRSAVNPRAVFGEGCLSDAPKLERALIGAEAVMQLATNSLVGGSMTNPAKYFRNNVA